MTSNASVSRIVVLSAAIHHSTQLLDSYLTTNGHPSPSFDVSTPPDLPFSPEVTRAKDAALEAIDELRALIMGPVGQIFYEYTHTEPTSLTSMHAIAKFKMASSFPLHGTTTIPELAKSTGMDEGDCKRIVRHALSHHLFLEPSPGVIAHSAMTQAIAITPLLREWMEDTSENMWRSGPRIVAAMEKWPGSDEPAQSAYTLSHHTTLPFFEDINQDLGQYRVQRFRDSMAFFQGSPGMHTSWIVDNYPWDMYRSVVDIGGSHGVVAIELAKKYPSLQCTVQDLAEVVSAAKTGMPNVTFQAYDFFTPQPIRGADVYLFRMIFHNWGDKYCIDILRNLVPALKAGARVVVNDHVVPDPGFLSVYKDRSVRAFDLVMKACFNAKERDMEDWTRLLKEADERFMIVQIKRPEGSQLQIIDIEWDR